MKCLFLALVAPVLMLSAGGTPLFWTDPGPVESLDLAGGPGGRNNAPQAPFIFVSEEKGGTSPKVVVRDARGTEWMVKFGEEVKSENFASRIVWAAGYFAEPTYFIPQGKIDGITKLGRAAAVVGRQGAFTNARFQLRDEGMHGAQRWSLTDPMLKGSRELAGLKLLAVLLANWDVKPENLSIVPVKGKAVYAITDWGATMGRPAEIMGRTKWDCASFDADSQHLIDGIENGFVVLNYQGKQGYEILRGIRADDARWLMRRLGRLSDAQIHAALKASGATPEEQSCFAPAFRTRLEQLAMILKSPAEPVNTYSKRERKTVTTTRQR